MNQAFSLLMSPAPVLPMNQVRSLLTSPVPVLPMNQVYSLLTSPAPVLPMNQVHSLLTSPAPVLLMNQVQVPQTRHLNSLVLYPVILQQNSRVWLQVILLRHTLLLPVKGVLWEINGVSTETQTVSKHAVV